MSILHVLIHRSFLNNPTLSPPKMDLFPATFLEGPLKCYIATFHAFYLPFGTIKAQRFINMHSVNVLC